MGKETERDATRIPGIPVPSKELTRMRGDVSTRIPNILSVSFDLILIAVAPPPPLRVHSKEGRRADGRAAQTDGNGTPPPLWNPSTLNNQTDRQTK